MSSDLARKTVATAATIATLPPQFPPIEQTSLQYATNTQNQVIQDGDIYNLCFQGVWFISTTPDGPWQTADSAPKEIYPIPPTSPVYNVTYETTNRSNATAVQCSTTARYFGMFIANADKTLSELPLRRRRRKIPPLRKLGPNNHVGAGKHVNNHLPWAGC